MTLVVGRVLPAPIAQEKHMKWVLKWLAQRAYKAGYSAGYSAGRTSKQQQSYAQGYADGKRDGRAAERGEGEARARSSRAAYEQGVLDERARWAMGEITTAA